MDERLLLFGALGAVARAAAEVAQTARERTRLVRVAVVYEALAMKLNA